MILDVGSGNAPIGDVNCDLYFRDDFHRANLPMKRIGEMLRCDGQHLPFRDGTFEEVHCSHLIEHVENPLLLLTELIRVSNSRIFIRTPYRFSLGYAKVDAHRWFFNKRWFATTLNHIAEKQSLIYRINYDFRGFSFITEFKKGFSFPIWISLDITVSMRKPIF